MCGWDEGVGGSEPLGGGGGDPVVLPTPGFLAPTSMFTFVVLVITIVICLCHVCFGHFKYLSAHNYKVWAGDEVECGRPGGVWVTADVSVSVGVVCRAKGGRGCWGMSGAKDRNVSSPSLDPLRLNTQRQMPLAPEVMDGPQLLALSPNLR